MDVVLPETLRYSYNVEESRFVRSVQARLSASYNGKRPKPRCRVEVWLESHAEDGRSDTELAYCEGSVTLGNHIARVVWLGKSRRRDVHSDIRGKPCDVAAADGAAPRTWTFAHALVGLSAAIMQRFSTTQLELQVDDDGSGRLVKYYRNLGFDGSKLDSLIKMMSAPIGTIAALAPPSWLHGLFPAHLSLWSWYRPLIEQLDSASARTMSLSTCVVPATQLRLLGRFARKTAVVPDHGGHFSRGCKSTKGADVDDGCRRSANDNAVAADCSTDGQCADTAGAWAGRLGCNALAESISPARPAKTPPLAPHYSSWTACWPAGGCVRVALSQRKRPGHLQANVFLQDAGGLELAMCRAALPPNKAFAQVLWLGRSGGIPASASVRGQRVYGTAWSGDVDTKGGALAGGLSAQGALVTAPMAILGVVAALALQCGCKRVELQPLDDGSRKLVRYFSGHSFETAPTSRGVGTLHAATESLALRCLPSEWRAELDRSAAFQWHNATTFQFESAYAGNRHSDQDAL
eukprot:CAMPEP_0117493274 /NCGR_PEP_ID=MMETSP0784-20121206/19015_1 /TAXON_ID=39447 /ORGANISM="" /LENGTH=520 /DNA_ID=CAMNT_0005288125 /DNA_START=77 /DNA_END=1636 /DNA_ORIENTATION=+